MPMDEAAAVGDIFITATGCRDVVTSRHFSKMKNHAILANAGHFDIEVDRKSLSEQAIKCSILRDNIEGFTLPDGRTLIVLAEGRLVNLASGNGHPAEIMDMSFAVQTLSLLWMLENGKSLDNKVYEVTETTDNRVAELRLRAAGISIDTLTEEQKKYLYGENNRRL